MGWRTDMFSTETVVFKRSVFWGTSGEFEDRPEKTENEMSSAW